jgi:hypothetical protein
MEKGSAASFLALAIREHFSAVLNEPLPEKLVELVGQLRAREEAQKRADNTNRPQRSQSQPDRKYK